MSHFEFPSSGESYFAAAISKFTALFSIDEKSGSVSEIQRIESDFHEKDPDVAKVRWSQDCSLIVSGGEDGVMKIFKVISSGANKYSGIELQIELGVHSEAINDVCINKDNSLAISSSTDKTCRIYSLKDNK